jgi:hypothetical protein
LSISDNRDALVPYFKTNKSQIIFEFFYLVCLFLVAVFFTFLVHVNFFDIDSNTKRYLLAALGAFLGAWTFDAKWFYMVTAKGRDNEKRWTWEYHKFYWRILTPFVGGILSFSLFLLGNSGVIQIKLGPGATTSSAAGFSFCFVMGYFSDVVMTKLSKLANGISGS